LIFLHLKTETTTTTMARLPTKEEMKAAEIRQMLNKRGNPFNKEFNEQYVEIIQKEMFSHLYDARHDKYKPLEQFDVTFNIKTTDIERTKKEIKKSFEYVRKITFTDDSVYDMLYKLYSWSTVNDVFRHEIRFIIKVKIVPIDKKKQMQKKADAEKTAAAVVDPLCYVNNNQLLQYAEESQTEESQTEESQTEEGQ
jgi:hypothetical protein